MDANQESELKTLGFFTTLGKITAGIGIVLGLAWGLVRPRCN